MPSRLSALCFRASSPPRLTRFWSEVLGWEIAGADLLPADDTGFRIRFLPAGGPKAGRNRIHFDLTSTSAQDQQRTVARALELGAQHIDVGQRPEEGHVVLADPEGNEFCVIEPGNGFLADCGFIGALSCDGSQQVGYFWSEALGWPLVWDQDQETAIRSPHGGPKITWGGPPLMPAIGPNRLFFELTAGPSEVDRLIALGATLSEDDEDGGVLMADPDGNEFRLTP
ncbi:VOC family protein [Actinoplanes sp. NPDC049681]|uniref:VOC family protein n=1 Tax=Actinoplanes sp. NPDC049681 TaxID=3363905 RepID=UPI00378E7A59